MIKPLGADLLLGLDAGTTLVKAAIYTPDGRCLGAGEAPQPTTSPQPSWVEQEPTVWWQGMRRAVRKCLALSGVSGEAIAAIGLSTQAGTLAVFDADGKPKGPALVWSDLRQRMPENADKAIIEEHFKLTGLPHLNMSPAAIGWLRAHKPEWFAGSFRIGYVPDYLTFRLTGEWVSDSTNIGLSNLISLASGDLALPAIERLGLTRNNFAVTRQAGNFAGELLPKAAGELGLRPGIAVAVPVHDQYAAALGAGCIHVGDALISCGTAWVLHVTVDRPITDRNSSFWPGRHVQPNLWGLLGAISTGGSTLERMLVITNQRRAWDKISAALQAIPPGSDGLLVIPHLAGRTIPTWQTQARGAILGWALGHSREHLWRAALEGIALETRVASDYFIQQGVKGNELRMVGGAARSAIWPKILASVLNVPVQVNASENIAVRGAASLAARALGGSDLPQSDAWQKYLPEPAWRNCYDEIYARYQEAIRRLEGGLAHSRNSSKDSV